jgi:hypothetical protein
MVTQLETKFDLVTARVKALKQQIEEQNKRYYLEIGLELLPNNCCRAPTAIVRGLASSVGQRKHFGGHKHGDRF